MSETQATTLVRIAESGYRFGADLDGSPFAVDEAGPNVALPLRGRSGLRTLLAQQYRRIEGKPPTAAALSDAIASLEAECDLVEREPVAVRVAQQAGRVIVDLGCPAGRALVIVAGSWRVVRRSPVLFRRTALTGQLPDPTGVAPDLTRLASMLNVSAETLPLLAGWLVAAWLPEFPAPVLFVHGEQGTGKSSATRYVVQVADPGPVPLRSAPRDVGDWVTAAAGSRVIGLDNLSSIPGWLSDALCRSVTGDGQVRRALYTDGDLAVVSFRRAIALNTIDSGSLRGDLADRMLWIELERIGEHQRRPEAALSAAWEAAHPSIVAGLADLTAKVLELLPSIELAELPRMADFARVLAAVDQVLSSEGLAKFRAQKSELAANVIDGDLVAAAVRDLALARATWEGSATDLLKLLTEVTFGERRPPRSWPTSPQAMSGALTRMAPSLRAVGIGVEQLPRTKAGRRVRLSVDDRRFETSSPSSPSSPSQVRGVTRSGDEVSENVTQVAAMTRGDEVGPENVTLPQSSDQGKQWSGDEGDAFDGKTDLLSSDPADCPQCNGSEYGCGACIDERSLA